MLLLAAIVGLKRNVDHQPKQVLPPLTTIIGHIGLAIIAFVYILITSWSG